MIAVAATPADLDSRTACTSTARRAGSGAPRSCAGSPPTPDVLHVDSLACCVPPGSTRILRAAARQRNHGAIVCLNVNVKPAVMESPARGRLLMDRPIRSADVVRASVDDIAWLYPGRSPEAVAQQWLGPGPKLVVIANGSDGVVAIQDSGAVLHRAAARSMRRRSPASTPRSPAPCSAACISWPLGGRPCRSQLRRARVDARRRHRGGQHVRPQLREPGGSRRIARPTFQLPNPGSRRNEEPCVDDSPGSAGTDHSGGSA